SWTVCQTSRVSLRPASIVLRASWLAWTVVKASVPPTSSTTSAAMNSRILPVSPMFESCAPSVLLAGLVVLAELVLVRRALELGGVERERGLDRAAVLHLHGLGGLAGALVPGLEHPGARRDVGDRVAAVLRDLRPVRVVAHQHEAAHLRVDVAVDADDAGVLEDLGRGLGLLVELEVEAVVARDREHVVEDGVLVRELHARADADHRDARQEGLALHRDRGVFGPGARRLRPLDPDHGVGRVLRTLAVLLQHRDRAAQGAGAGRARERDDGERHGKGPASPLPQSLPPANPGESSIPRTL